MFTVVSNELRIAKDIVSSERIHGAMVADRLDSKLVSFLGGERTITGTGDVQEAVSNWIQLEIEAVQAAEKIHLDELGALKLVRQQRDGAETELYQKARGLRGTIEGTVGPGQSAILLGLDPGLARVDSQVLLRYAKRALEKLEAPGFQPSSTVRGATIEPREAAEGFRPVVSGLETVLDALQDQKRITEQAQRVKNEALDRLRFVMVNGTRILEGFYTIAGERFHAERIRTSRTRSRVSSGSPEPEAAKAPSTDGPSREPAASGTAGDATPVSAGEKAGG